MWSIGTSELVADGQACVRARLATTERGVACAAPCHRVGARIGSPRLDYATTSAQLRNLGYVAIAGHWGYGMSGCTKESVVIGRLLGGATLNGVARTVSIVLPDSSTKTRPVPVRVIALFGHMGVPHTGGDVDGLAFCLQFASAGEQPLRVKDARSF